ncbi:SMP-30/gluconolactonase/LRE family protein [Pseudonocardia sp. N23]|uniref:SMP-30/gluconolactonase/LRE family protein n=1 Tax=Pseudonocardia sp. N23 TaxID=1987376 RepID=UPI000BFCB76C|nr:SMP-30/gluconolactonase/LRE family protein [Pseudonocardia sp. N23]GAY11198.1 gluconolactonase [Pseudonocardia sp. N23]
MDTLDYEVATTGLEFPEGPIAMADGSVVVVEIKGGRLTRVAADGTRTSLAECGGGPNGAAVGPDGAFYVCNNGGSEWVVREGRTVPGVQGDGYLGGSIQRVTADGDVTDLYTHVDGHGLRGPNDIVFDDEGGFWFTDMGKIRPRELDQGGLYYATADGSSITEVVYPMLQPNGVGLSPDGRTVHVAETTPGRLWAFDLDGPGRIRRDPATRNGGRLQYGFPGLRWLDSLGVDADGNVCVATLQAGEINVVSPGGELLATHVPPGGDTAITNICFGGPDMRTAWITASGTGVLWRTTWDRPGLRLAYNA